MGALKERTRERAVRGTLGLSESHGPSPLEL